MHNITHRTKGAILIELIISLALGLLLFAILFQLYLLTERSYRLQTALNQLQQQGTSAMAALRAAVHKAGYIGCARLTSGFPVRGFQNYTLTAQNKLQATDNGHIVVRHAAVQHATLVEDMHDYLFMLTNKQIQYAKGDILIISDCVSAEIFQVAEVHRTHGQQKILPSRALLRSYSKNSEVARLVWEEYSIEHSKNKNGSPMMALHVQGLKQGKVALVEGIESMQVMVTVNDQGSDQDLPVSWIDDWSQVTGLAVTLALVASPYKKNWYGYFAVT